MPSRHAAPGRIVVEGDPSERGFEQMHVRVRALRQPVRAVLAETAEWMGIGSCERRTQRHGLATPAGRLAERAVAARIGEQCKGLVVEIEIRFD